MVTHYALTSEFWLLETFVIALFVNIDSKIQVIYSFSRSLIIVSLPAVSIMRNV